MSAVTLQMRRIYEPAEPTDGFRVLVDRLWPRGISKEKAELDLWAKDVTPSTELREHWHHASAEEWETYAAQYAAELDANPAVDELAKELVAQAGPVVTLLYAAHNTEQNHVHVLMPVLQAAVDAAA